MSGPDADGGTARILVVDDDPVMRLVVRRALERDGAGEIVEAEDGLAAREVLERSDIDVVVTDLLMPRLDGLSLMRWALEHAPGPRWVILSGVDTFDAAVEAVNLGAYAFLTKPPHARQVALAVRNALTQIRLERQRERLTRELEASHRELLDHVRELEDRSAAMQRDLQRAEVIQRVLLPNQPPALEQISLQAVYRPGRFVGGDLYNVQALDDHHVGIYVADATGHGVSSAMLSVLFHRRLALTGADGAPIAPADVLAGVNRAICAERIAPGLFLTAAYCLLDTRSATGTIALAGHPPAILRRASGAVQRIPRSGPALGLTTGAAYEQETFHLAAGDRLLLYTDGVLEGAGAGVAWLEDELARPADDARTIVERLAAAARDGPDGAAADPDDITLLLLEVGPGASSFDNGDARGVSRPAAHASPALAAIVYGESEAGSFLSIRGRGTWVTADLFHEVAAGILEEGRTVRVDLADCEHLDSTFLGTIHELADLAGRHRAGFTLQNVPAALRDLFAELDMTRVLDCIRPAPESLPELKPLDAVVTLTDARARVLHAHERLAALSDRNRDRFRDVLDTLRTPGDDT